MQILGSGLTTPGGELGCIWPTHAQVKRAGISFLLMLGITSCTWNQKQEKQEQPLSQPSIGAFGTIVPVEQLRNITISGSAGENRQVIERLHAEEGDSVKKGQIIAELRNKRQLENERKRILRNIRGYEKQLQQSSVLLKRLENLSRTGAYPWYLYQERLIISENTSIAKDQAFIQLEDNEIRLSNSTLRAPFDGVITRIYSRSGEAISKDGIFQMGNLERLQAQLEIYESDIGKVRLGQQVKIRSETGSFSGTVNATVTQIVPGIRMRTTLPTTSTPMVDVRVGIVRAEINRNDSSKLKIVVGTKVIGKILI